MTPPDASTLLDSGMGTVPERVGILGGGRMGAGIAHAFLTCGAQVRVVERDEDAAQVARARIEHDLSISLERGSIGGDVVDWSRSLSVGVAPSMLTECELVVEAVPEYMSVKVASLRSVEAYVRPDAWLASNTSSLSIDALADHLQRPDRFCGLHFFNPVPASKLVEIVNGSKTAAALRALAVRWVTGIGKTPIVVQDAPGFASSRLGVAIALEAIRMVEEGVATPQDIDNAMVLGYKHPIGPLALTDIVGLDVRLAIAEALGSRLGERFQPPRLLRDMVGRGELGRKSGQGFYRYGAAQSRE